MAHSERLPRARALGLKVRFAYGKVASCYFSRTPDGFGRGTSPHSRESPNAKTSLWRGFWFGAPGEIRTPDQLVRSQLLYPTELRVRGFLF
jgi:hypothetical protein